MHGASARRAHVRNESVVNLKELEQLKELVDDTLECINQADELVAEEMAIPGHEGDDPDMDSGLDERSSQDLGSRDEPQDPLAEARVMLTRAFANMAEVLDITEPHRKRYRDQAGKSSRAAGLAQKALREVVNHEKKEELTNGSHAKTTRSLRRPIRS